MRLEKITLQELRERYPGVDTIAGDRLTSYTLYDGYETDDNLVACWEKGADGLFVDRMPVIRAQREVAAARKAAARYKKEDTSAGKIVCPQCGAYWEEDDDAYFVETGLCQCCHEPLWNDTRFVTAFREKRITLCKNGGNK